MAPSLNKKRKTIEQQVLEDLAATDDETAKLEILDSYGAYKQREFRQDISYSSALEIGASIGNMLGPVLLNRIPEPFPFHRARMGKTTEPTAPTEI